jgi:hypothetical protein
MTAKESIILKNQQVGNTHIKNMQGTTRNLYHFLPIDGRQNYQFFKELNKSSFPFTNIDQNKLAAGETLGLQRAYFVYMIADKTTGTVTAVTSIESSPIAAPMGAGIWNFVQGNQNITKDIFTGSFQSEFNKGAKFILHSVFYFDTLATLLENVDFYSTLQLPTMPTVTNGYLGLIIEGVGSILNLKTNS